MLLPVADKVPNPRFVDGVFYDEVKSVYNFAN